MKDQSLRVLIIEDSENDALLITRELKKGGYNPVYERVETAAAMGKALKEKQWDIILCDYKMPKFNAPSAIAILKEANIDIPIIIVSGTIGETVAIECMRLGAQDYIMKDNLSRLCPAIARELEDAKVRYKQKQAEEALRNSEIKYRTLFESASDAIFLMDRDIFIDCNQKTLEMFGCTREQIIGQPPYRFSPEVQPDGRNSKEKALEKINAAIKGQPQFFEWKHCRYDGTLFDAGISLNAFHYKGKYYIQAIVRDVTDRKKVEDELKNSELKYRNIFENAVEGIYQSTIEGRFITANAALARMAGYDSPEELIASIKDIGTQFYVHPEDRKKLIETSKAKGFVDGFEVEFYKKDESIFWVVINARTVKDEQGKILYIEGLIEDITIRKHAEEQLHQTLESLRKAIGTTIQVLVSAVESRDPYTGGHQLRVADLARTIATEMGFPREKIEGIRVAGSIHDIGKLSIPAEILAKPTRLTNIEFSIIKEHSQSGYEMLKDVESPWPLAEIVYEHHERMNGTGYPRNLKGDDILMEARIMAVADVVEAMASHRPYRPSLGIEAALEEIEKNKGILYDNTVANVCLKLFREKGYQLT
ncbi:MAG: HD domain-containing phosphohydrolase [Smithella sp.]|jgi:PAS domain S-box-containing protein/putative nucleotidyltransferase with HDIG domain